MRYTVIKMDIARNTVCFSDADSPSYDSFKEAFRGAVEKADDEIDLLLDASAGTRGFCYGIPDDEDFRAGRSVKVVLYAGNETRVVSERFIVRT